MPRHSFDCRYIYASVFSRSLFFSFSFFFFSFFFLLRSYYFVLEFENTWLLYHSRTEGKKAKKTKERALLFSCFCFEHRETKSRKSSCKIYITAEQKEKKQRKQKNEPCCFHVFVSNIERLNPENLRAKFTHINIHRKTKRNKLNHCSY